MLGLPPRWYLVDSDEFSDEHQALESEVTRQWLATLRFAQRLKTV